MRPFLDWNIYKTNFDDFVILAVAVVSRTKEEVDALAEEAGCLALVADVSVPSEVEKVFQQV